MMEDHSMKIVFEVSHHVCDSHFVFYKKDDGERQWKKEKWLHATKMVNLLTANDELSRLENLTYFNGPGYWGGYLGALRPMLLCVTLCPLMNCQKTVKIMAFKGLNKVICDLDCMITILITSVTNIFFFFLLLLLFLFLDNVFI